MSEKRSYLERKLETLMELFEKLKTTAEEGVPIIVEGRNDLDSLRELGVDGHILCAKTSRKPLPNLLESLKGEKEAVILTDFDRRGAELAGSIVSYLEEMGAKPNLFYWRKVGRLVRRDVKDVEGLASYIGKLRRKLK